MAVFFFDNRSKRHHIVKGEILARGIAHVDLLNASAKLVEHGPHNVIGTRPDIDAIGIGIQESFHGIVVHPAQERVLVHILRRLLRERIELVGANAAGFLNLRGYLLDRVAFGDGEKIPRLSICHHANNDIEILPAGDDIRTRLQAGRMTELVDALAEFVCRCDNARFLQLRSDMLCRSTRLDLHDNLLTLPDFARPTPRALTHGKYHNSHEEYGSDYRDDEELVRAFLAAGIPRLRIIRTRPRALRRGASRLCARRCGNGA